jgi:glycosyltransferase EpsD
MSKKILFISNHAGFSKFNAPYMQDLHEDGVVVHNASPGIETGYYDKHIDVPMTRTPFSLSNIVSLFKLIKTCNQEKYDLIHCHTPVGGILGRILKIFSPKLKVIYTAHGFHFFKGAGLHMWLFYFPVEYVLSYLTDCIVTINEEDYIFAKEKLKAGDVRKINGVGVDLERFKPNNNAHSKMRTDLNYKEDDFVVIYAAQMIERKNHKFLIEAFSRFSSSDSIKLLLVGDGPLISELKALVSIHGLEAQVKFTGYVSNVEDYYKCSDLLVSVSKQEGFGLNLVEGLASGLTYLASDVRGHRDIHSFSDANLLFDLKDSNDFLLKLEKLYRSNGQSSERLKLDNINSAKVFEVHNSVGIMKVVYKKYLA